MRYLAKDAGNSAAGAQNSENASVREFLKTVLKGLGFNLIELVISRHKGSVQVRMVIYNGSPIGTDDCSKVHRAVMPRLELAFGQQEPQPSAKREGSPPDIYLEVSSPGIDRLIKDTEEFVHYIGRGIRCYRTDISDWTGGFLESVNENGITIKTNEGAQSLSFDIIAKAKLDPSQEV